MKKVFKILFILLLSTNASAQKEKDIKAIKAMSGCYKVGFNFAETFNYSKDSTYRPSKVKHDWALEWAQIIDNKNDNKIQLQHLLVIDMKDETMIIKHWRQDWIYENQDIYDFDKKRHWKYKKLPKKGVKGQWTQKVYQVDDSPRYEGSGSWVHIDGKTYWESTTSAPLPRREYTKRRDYNVTLRRNRQEITSNGWVHDQNNDKIIREDGKKDFVLAQEKGYNTYVKVPDSKCIAAQNWWKENKPFWSNVREKWEKIYRSKKDITLRKKVDKKALYSHLFKMDPKKTKKKEINTIIEKFMK